MNIINILITIHKETLKQDINIESVITDFLNAQVDESYLAVEKNIIRNGVCQSDFSGAFEEYKTALTANILWHKYLKQGCEYEI